METLKVKEVCQTHSSNSNADPDMVVGVFDFWGLTAGGFLTSDGQPAPGIHYRFDDCSQTAYIYNSKTQVQVSFDDTRASKAKGQYITHAGLRGFSTWEAGGDSNDLLLNAILGGIGHTAQSCA